MENIARFLVIGGIILILIGGGVYLAAKFGIPLGRLPGDIWIEGKNGSFYFPLATSILVSVLLTIILNLVSRFLNKWGLGPPSCSISDGTQDLTTKVLTFKVHQAGNKDIQK